MSTPDAPPAASPRRAPVWAAVRGTSPAPDVLAGEVAADIAVLGAGIVGLTLATVLAEAGADVVVVDRGRVGEGVSGRSNAKVTALHQVVYADLAARHGHHTARTYAEASSEAVGWVRDRAGAAWEPRDAVTVARDGEEMRVLREEHAAAIAAGLPVHLEEAGGGWRGAAGALRLPDQGQVDPVALLHALLDGLPPTVRVLQDSPITALVERPGRARLRGPGGSVTADRVVVCTGLPIFDRGGFFALCEPKMSFLSAIDHGPAGTGRDGAGTDGAGTDGAGSDGAGAAEDMMISAGEPTRSVRWARRDGRRVLLVGGEGRRTGTASDASPYEVLETWARSTFPDLGEVVARWSAQDFMSPDRLPYAGPLLRLGGPVDVVTGLSKWGFTLGVAAALALGHELAGGARTPFGALVDTARLPGLRGAATIARSNTEVAVHMAGGWASALARPLDTEPAEGEGHVGRSGLTVGAACRVQGTVHRTSAVCRHLGGIVSWNPDDGTWDCPLHGSRFAPDGAVLHGPATRSL